jgi:plasmid stability protein
MIGEPIMEAEMDDKLTVDLDRETMEALSRQAEAHGHGVDAEAREILKRNVGSGSSGDRQAIIAEFRRIRAMTPPGVKQTSSVQLIREDRDR